MRPSNLLEFIVVILLGYIAWLLTGKANDDKKKPK